LVILKLQPTSTGLALGGAPMFVEPINEAD